MRRFSIAALIGISILLTHPVFAEQIGQKGSSESFLKSFESFGISGKVGAEGGVPEDADHELYIKLPANMSIDASSANGWGVSCGFLGAARLEVGGMRVLFRDNNSGSCKTKSKSVAIPIHGPSPYLHIIYSHYLTSELRGKWVDEVDLSGVVGTAACGGEDCLRHPIANGNNDISITVSGGNG
jgi:hypothetical protein